MNTKNVNLKMILTLILSTAFNVACSSGELPAGITSSTSSSVAADTMAPSLMFFATSNSILVGGTSTLSVTGGVAPYSLTLSNTTGGKLSKTQLIAEDSVTFTGVTAASVAVVVTVIDKSGTKLTQNILVSPAAPQVSMATKAIYSYSLSYFYATNDGTDDIVMGAYTKQIDSAVTPTGWTAKGLAYYVFINQVPNSLALNQCVDSAGQTFESVANATGDQTCEGLTFSKVLGYVYPKTNSTVAGTTALSRYIKTFNVQRAIDDGDSIYWVDVRPGHSDHITTASAAQAVGYTSEGIIAYTPTTLAAQ